MRALLVAPVLVISLVAGVSACASRSLEQTKAEACADLVMRLLIDGDVDRASASFHYPEFYSEAQRLNDSRGVGELLRALLENFGTVESYRVSDGIKDAYEVGVFGGTVSYWEKLPNAGFDEVVVYRTHFSKEGPGLVKIAFFFVGGERRIRVIAFGIEADQEQAQWRVERAQVQLQKLLDE